MKFKNEYSSRFRILKGGKISLVVSALLGGATMSFAAPTDGTVTSGIASISQNANVTTITQSTQKASINWQNFSIAQNETVNFNQPNASSITLNRVIGNEKSIISGALNANGQVWILNSNGILFNKNASINTSGLLATTKNLTDTDFQSGNYNFTGDSTQSVINLGTIDIQNNGSVILGANEVQNEGIIKAIKGKIHLIGAEEYSIDLNGNSLVSLTVSKGVLDAMVTNSGTIIADGAEVYLTTNAVDEFLKGVVNNTGVIEANSIDDFNTHVELFAHGGTVNIGGTIEAIDGFVETSADTVKIDDSFRVTADKWLIDPVDFTIAASGGDTTGTTISTNLVTTDIEIQSVNGASGTKGDIYVNDTITWSSDKQLTLNASDSIYINSAITASAGKLALYYGQSSSNSGNTSTYNVNAKVNLSAGDNFFTKLGNDGTDTIWKVVTDDATMQSFTLNDSTKYYVLGTDLALSGTNNWTPIGSSSSSAFKGNFDGLGHTISNVNINSSDKYVGLFGYTDGATIKNIGVVDASITGTGGAGGFGGGDGGEVTVGGLIASATDTTVTNSYTSGDITGTGGAGGGAGGGASGDGGDATVGGLIASATSSTITSSFYNITKNTGMDDESLTGVTGKSTKELSYGQIFKDASWDIVADSTVTSTTPVLKYNSTTSSYYWAIAPLDVTYTLSDESKTYDGDTQTLSTLYTDVFGSDYSFVDTDAYKFQVSESDVTGYKNAGTYSDIKVISDNDFLTIASSGNTDGKYTISKADITAITGITASNKTYDGTTDSTLTTSSADFTGIISGDTLSVATSTGTFDTKDVDTDKTVSITGLTLGGSDKDNYNLTTTTASTTADITAVVVVTPTPEPIVTPISVSEKNVDLQKEIDSTEKIQTHLVQIKPIIDNSIISFEEEGKELIKIEGVDTENSSFSINSDSSLVVVNGGVHLPSGLEQEFYSMKNKEGK